MSRIVVAEDDERQAEVLTAYLQREGHTVVHVRDGRAAVDEIRRLEPDLVVLDVMMPKMDGLDVARIIRADSNVPILMVTARSTEDDLLLGLDLGADDYVTKPYSPRELMARIRVLLRRTSQTETAADIVTIDDLVVDQIRHEVRRGGKPVSVTPREFAMLAVLASQPGRAFTRRQILDAAVGFDHYSLERTVDTHLLNLRRKIEDDPSKPRFIETVKGRGYRLAEQPTSGSS